MQAKRCRHCRRRDRCRPRGLCWRCYQKLAVRARFGSLSKYARRGLLNFCGTAKPPPTPTQALPGTPEKIAVLAQRASLRQDLWHPLDAPLDLRVLARVG